MLCFCEISFVFKKSIAKFSKTVLPQVYINKQNKNGMSKYVHTRRK